MHYLVTGGAGFIGSNLVRALLDQDHRIRVLDDFSTGLRSNLADLGGRFELIEGDLAAAGVAARAVEGIDGIFHEAAIPAVPRSIEDPLGTHRVNVNGTLALLECARAAGVGRLVYAASSSAYGNLEAEVKREDLLPDPCSPYAVQKLTAELYCKVYTETLGMPAVALRYFNVFGPRQRPDSDYAAVVPAFARRMLAGAPPHIFGDGLQSRDFTFIDDVVAANLAAMNAPISACGKVYNVACGRRTTLLDLVEMLNTVLGTRLQPVFEPPRAGDVLHSLADVSRARRWLDWEPRVSLEEGLARTVAWIKGP